MSQAMQVLLVSGSTRAGSTNTAVLRTVAALAPAGVTATLYGALADLPAFNPDDDTEPLHPSVAELRRQVAAADAVLFCTPEYAGALPGSFKNLLDWTVGGGEIYGKPAAWVNASSVAAPTAEPTRTPRSSACSATSGLMSSPLPASGRRCAGTRSGRTGW